MSTEMMDSWTRAVKSLQKVNLSSSVKVITHSEK